MRGRKQWKGNTRDQKEEGWLRWRKQRRWEKIKMGEEDKGEGQNRGGGGGGGGGGGC